MGGTLRKEVVQALLTAAGEDPAAVMAAAGNRGFKARPLGITIDLTAHVKVERSESNNMLGLLRGREHPDEVVAYSAHWDHMGIGVPVNGDSIYNGAVDNASGTAALLAIAAAYRARPEPPARSVLFWATTCEEQGTTRLVSLCRQPGHSTRTYRCAAEHGCALPVRPRGRHGRDRLRPVRAGGPPGSGHRRGRTRSIARRHTRSRRVLPERPLPPGQEGVPALFAVGNPKDDSDAELMGKFTSYVTTSYHKPSDELTDAWDLGGIVQDARTYYRLGLGLAEGTAWPNWKPNSEFRRLRDAMKSAAGIKMAPRK
jgi:hypothetical protein